MEMKFIFLQAAAADWLNPMLMLGMVLIFWLFFIRPQTQKAKKEQQYLGQLEKGMEVVTKSGMLGRINKIDNNIITLQVDTKTFIQVTRGAISKEMTDAVYNEDDEKK